MIGPWAVKWPACTQKKEPHALAHSRENLPLPWEKSKKTLGEPWFSVERFLQPSVAAARCRSIAPARRGGPPFSHPFGRCGRDLIKPTTSQKSPPPSRNPLPSPSRLPKHPLPKPSPQPQPQPPLLPHASARDQPSMAASLLLRAVRRRELASPLGSVRPLISTCLHLR